MVTLSTLKFQVATLVASYAQTAATLLPLSYWKLGEGSGTTAVDNQSAHDGTYAGSPTLGVPAIWNASGNSAVTFDGVNDTVSMGDVAAFRFTGAFTISCWIRYTANGVGGIVGKVEAASVGAAGYGLQVNTGTTKLQFFAFTAAEVQVFNVITTNGYGDGRWHHVACTWDGTTTANKVIIYVDGVSVATGTAAAGTIGTGTYPFRLGARGTTAADFYAGTIDEVSIYSSALSAANIASLAAYANDWVSTYDADWSQSEVTTLTRGMADTQIATRTASVGTVEWSLRNGTNSVGGVNGYYSLDSSHFNGVTTLGKRVRWLATYSGVDYVVWSGRIRSLTPVGGKYSERTVIATAHDAIGDLSLFAIREIPPQVNQTETALIALVAAALPGAVRPDVVLDAAKETYPYALDDLGADAGNGLAVLETLVISAWGLCWVDPYNAIRYRNRRTQDSMLNSGSPVYISLTEDDFEDLVVRGSSDRSVTRVRVTVHPRFVDAAATTQLCSGAGQLVPANSTVTISLNYRDPAQKHTLIGAVGQVTPLTTPAHYLANANKDGSGADLTANISIVTTAFTASATFAITNAGGTDAYMTLLQLLGQGIYDDDPVTYEDATGASGAFYDNALTIDMPHKADGIVPGTSGSNLANMFATGYSDAPGYDSLSEVAFNPQKSATLMGYALTKDIGDLVHISETMTGINAYGMIVAIQHEVSPGPILRTRWFLAKPAALPGAY